MIAPRRRERRVLLATAVCAVGAPLSAGAWLSARTDALAEHATAAGGVPVRLGGVDADLTGTIRLSDVAFGELIAAAEVEASVALDSLLAGTLRADEIRIAGPRVAVQVERDGDSDLARLARRLAAGRTQTADKPAAASRLRRIVVSSGTLSARIAGLGEVVASGVELVPDRDGVRVITGPLRFAGRAGAFDVELGFARGAAELALPQVRFRRALAVGGTGAVIPPPTTMPATRIALRDVAAGRLAVGSPIELRATVDDDGIPRPVAIDVAPRQGRIAIRGERLPLRAFAPLAPHGVLLDAARATGSLTVQRRDLGMQIHVDGALDGALLDHRVLAATPVPLAGQLQASLAISPEAITLARGALTVGAAAWTANGWLRRGSPGSGQLDVSLATAPCRDLLAALPAELRGPLDGMVLTGTFGARIRLAVDLAAPAGDGVALTTAIDDGCRTEAEPPGADVVTLLRPIPDGAALLAAPAPSGERPWIALRQLPRHVSGAFVSAEDSRFFDHAGFDLTQIARSFEIDLRERRLARGGSTISQQLVKNAFLTQRRSLDRKLQEAILTWRLEAKLDKRQILERYLNIIELGPRVFGLPAAARYWFDTSSRNLSARQAAFLAALTSEPTSMSRRVRRAGGLDADSAARVDIVLRAMWRDRVIDAATLEEARTAPLRFTQDALKQER